MNPIEVLYVCNDKYAEMATVSMTSLVHNTNRECRIHIFKNSLSSTAVDTILMLEKMYPHTKINFHHIPDEAFAKITDSRFGKEAWYRLLAPKILHNLNKVLYLDSDTVIDSDISELYDINLGNSYAAVRMFAKPELDCVLLDRMGFLNSGVMLLNLKALRKSGMFSEEKAMGTVEMLKAIGHPKYFYDQVYLSCIFAREDLIELPEKYNSKFQKEIHNTTLGNWKSYDEVHEAVNYPVIIHYAGEKPFGTPNNNIYDFRYKKWWDYLALSPLAQPLRDGSRLDEFIEHNRRFRQIPRSVEDYRKYCLFDDWLDAIDKLKAMRIDGMKIAVYGVGFTGARFIRLARLFGTEIDMICDVMKCGKLIDDIRVEPPEKLNGRSADTVVVIAIEKPRVWLDVKETLLAFGFQEKHIFPIFEHLAVGGRAWQDILDSIQV